VEVVGVDPAVAPGKDSREQAGALNKARTTAAAGYDLMTLPPDTKKDSQVQNNRTAYGPAWPTL
jgi:hypothetical protein